MKILAMLVNSSLLIPIEQFTIVLRKESPSQAVEGLKAHHTSKQNLQSWQHASPYMQSCKQDTVLFGG